MPYKKYKKTISEMKKSAERTKYKTGDMVETKIFHGNNEGYMTPGTKVEIVNVLEDRGYDIKDEKGNVIYNVGKLV